METLYTVDFNARESWLKWAEGEVANSGKPDVYGSSRFVSVRGQQAVLGRSYEGPLGLRFYENGVEYSIFSPTLPDDDAIALADGMK
jgi:hypothetical protein